MGASSHTLPSTRVLAADLRVSRNTVLLAQEQLAAEGYVVSRERSTTAVAGAVRPAGYAPLREALRDYLGRARGVACDADQIVIVNGSQQAFDLVARVLLDPGDAAVVEEPHYPA